jgi:lycopene cyclase domain-containing protein
VTYTELCLVAVAASGVLDLFVLRTRLLNRRAFWASYAIVLFFQLLTNGWLTGRGIVRYADAAVIGGSRPVLFGNGRLLYAPVEDVAFGFALVLQTLAWWVFWGRRGVQRDVEGEVRRRASSRPRDGRPAS